MMNGIRKSLLCLLVAGVSLASVVLTTACSSSGSGSTRTYIQYGAGYRGFYRRPWGYRPIYIGGGGREIDPDWGVEPPGGLIDMPMPDMGMPDIGTMDMGGFDW